MQIKRISLEERKEALNLVIAVFMQFEAPELNIEEGITTFKNFIDDENSIDALALYGAYEGEDIIGVAATRNNGNHISLFFVDGKRHRQGIGKRLFQEVLKNSTAETITVNSSPYAVEIYRKLGFAAMDKEQLTNGIRYTPMSYTKYVFE